MKSNRICTGYQRDRQFRNLSASNHDTLLSRSQPVSACIESLPLKCSKDNLRPTSVKEEQTPDQDSRGIVQAPDRVLHRSLALFQLFACFMNDYVPKSKTRFGQSNIVTSWMQILPNMLKWTAPLHLAIIALSMVRLGRRYKDKTLHTKGHAVYGHALRRMQIMLSNQDLLYQEQTLASCMTMSVFEVSDLFP